MRTTYKITMSDGALLDIADSSAGCAIQTALTRNPGQFVKACRSGLTNKECHDLRASGINAMPGIINHDVPEHMALTETQAKEQMRRRPKIIDATEAMFDDEQIKNDSTIAKGNFERGTI